jgi:hypothetical protein
MAVSRRWRFGVALLAGALVVSAAVAWKSSGSRAVPAQERPRLMLFTSLPILWNETPDLAAMLRADAPPHWARRVLEAHYTLVARDTLLAPPLDARFLLLAQPRPLAPQENVALDDWVRAGGRLLLFADPMLTADSTYTLGDRRRPQDIVLLSPILARWGLELRFDEDQPAGEHDAARENAGAALPVNLPGQFAPRPGGHDARCAIVREGLVARCRIGRGRALIVADAALFEPSDADGKRAAALDSLLEAAFAG